MPSKFEDYGSITPVEQTLREKTASKIADILGSTLAKGNKYKAQKIADTLVGGEQSNLPLGMGVASITPLEIPFAVQEGARDFKAGAKNIKEGNALEGAMDIGSGVLNVATAYPAVKVTSKALSGLSDNLIQAITGNPSATGAKVIDYASQMSPATKIDIGPKAKTWNKSSADIFQKNYKDYRAQGMTHDQANRQAWKDSQVEGNLGEAGTLGTRFLPGHGLAQEVTDRGFKTEMRPYKGKGLLDLFDKQSQAKYGKNWRDLSDNQKKAIRDEEINFRRVKNVSPHPELLKAYPEIGEYPAEIKRKARVEGGFAPQSKYYTISGPSAEERTSGALHELGHAVQHIEDWPTGSSPKLYDTKEYADKLKKLQDEYEVLEYAYQTRKNADRAGVSVDDLLKQQDADIAHLTGGAPPNLSPRIQEMMARGDLLAKTQPREELHAEFARLSQELDRTPMSPMQAYRQTMGEGHARMIENRRKNLTDEARKNRFPEDSYDFDSPVNKLRYDENLLDSPVGYKFPDEPQGMSLGGIAKGAKRAVQRKTPDIMKKVGKSKAELEAELQALREKGAVRLKGEEPTKEFVNVGASKNPAGKSKKQFEEEQAYKHDIEKTFKFKDPQAVNVEQLQGGVLVPIPGDRTLTGVDIKSVAGVPLSSPSTMYGGPRYGQKKLQEGAEDFWASNVSAAKGAQNRVKLAGEKGEPVYGMYVSMAPESGQFALHNADALIKQLDAMNPSKKQVREFDKLMRNRFPDFVGLKDPDLMTQLRSDSEMRKFLVDRMEKPTISTALDLPSGLATRHAITEPALRDTPTGLTGYSVGQMRPDVDLAYGQYYLHPTYDTKIPGRFMGEADIQLPWEYYFPDVAKRIAESPKHAEHAFGTFKASKEAIQPVTQEMVDNIMMLNELARKGMKNGGIVDEQMSQPEMQAPDMMPPLFNPYTQIGLEEKFDDGASLLEMEKFLRNPEIIRRPLAPVPEMTDEITDYLRERYGMELIRPEDRPRSPGLEDLTQLKHGGLVHMSNGGLSEEMESEFPKSESSRIKAQLEDMIRRKRSEEERQPYNPLGINEVRMLDAMTAKSMPDELKPNLMPTVYGTIDAMNMADQMAKANNARLPQAIASGQGGSKSGFATGIMNMPVGDSTVRLTASPYQFGNKAGVANIGVGGTTPVGKGSLSGFYEFNPEVAKERKMGVRYTLPFAQGGLVDRWEAYDNLAGNVQKEMGSGYV